MSKLVKELITKELTARYGTTTDAVWIEMLGVGGVQTNEFRRSLRSKQMRLEIVKTALLRRACASGPMAKLADQLTGPAALVTGGSSAIDVAKLLDEWAPKFPKKSVFRMRAALLEGELIDESQVKDLSKMPSRRDLQGRVASMLLSPGGKLVSALLSPGGNIAGCVKALIEKLEKAEAPAADAPAAAAG